MATLVCVPIMVNEFDAALADAAAARDAGADLVEFRVDEVFSGTGEESEIKRIVRLASESALPCIVTCRVASEGGHYDGEDVERVSLYERLGTASGKGEHPPRYIDVELATYTRSANIRQKIDLAVDHPGQRRELRTSLILSMHDFTARPSDLMRRLAAMQAEPAAAVLKVAYRARSLRDNLELLDLPAQTDRPTIALGMGEFGLMSRVLAPKFGGFLTFASLRSASTTAPGQPTVRELLEMFRFRSIRKTTGVYGIVGWPVGHSLSPLVHNAGFEAVGHDGVYLPMQIAADEDAEASYLSFKATMLELLHHERLDLRGCSVTIPHKQNLVRLARELGWGMDDVSRDIGAANTLVVEGAAVRVLNTDAPAAAEELERVLGKLAGKRVAVIGAGGVGRAVAYAAAVRGATVVVYNRTLKGAQELAAQLGAVTHGRIVAAELSLLAKTCCDAIVNCTPVGMSGGPAPKESPAPVSEMRECSSETVAMDTVYTPVETPFLRQAKGAGWSVIDGAGMFVRQAAMQFRAFTGREAPVELMERLVRGALAAREGAP